MAIVVGIQRRMMQLGRVRLGEKGAKGEPKKLNTFRFTSASRELLEHVANRYGGQVTDWAGAPDEGYFQVTTEANELQIILPPVFSEMDGTPTLPYSQFYELWSGGGCQRRCDGVTEALGGQPCMCNPEARECKITTRVSFMLPDIRGLGVWRLDSHGYNAAVELPGTLEVLLLAAQRQTFIPAVLRAEPRTKKVPGKGTHRFVVPVIDFPHSVKELASGEVEGLPLAINGPQPEPARPALPPAPVALPDEPAFQNDKEEPAPAWGAAPETTTFAPTVDELLVRLRACAVALGTTEAVEEAIVRDKEKNAEAPAKHVQWLERQVKRFEEKAAAVTS